jgi:hypothetical protein
LATSLMVGTMDATYQDIVELDLKVIYKVFLFAFSHLKLENSEFQLCPLDPLLAYVVGSTGDPLPLLSKQAKSV